MNAPIIRTVLLCGALLATTPGRAADDGATNPRSGAPAELGEAMNLSMRFHKVLFDRLEAAYADEGNAWRWDAQGWYGGDYHKLWVKAEGEAAFGEPVEEAELQLLYSRNVAAFWDFQAGLRYDLRPRPGKAHLALGFQGLAPYLFEVDAAAFLREDGLLSARLEAEYDLLITQRLILQPRMALSAQANGDPDRDVGAGLTGSQFGLRLRYEIRRELAPYLGLSWSFRHGDAAREARAAGEPTAIDAFVVGLRAWF